MALRGRSSSWQSIRRLLFSRQMIGDSLPARARLLSSKALMDDQHSEAHMKEFVSSPHVYDAGQPIFQTHPELLSNGELMPGITASDFANRRKSLMDLLPKESLLILSSATVKQMTNVVPYPYRQDADFLYYTGCTQPGGIAIIHNDDDVAHLCMFMPDADPMEQVWTGHIAGVREALDVFKADQANSLKEVSKILPILIQRAKIIYHNSRTSNPLYTNLRDFQEALQCGRVRDIRRYSDKIRLIKSVAEISLLKRSAEITSQAFLKTMEASKFAPHEHFLAAKVEFECKTAGAERMAWTPVVGGGANSATIHYSRNDQKVAKGDIVLMDAGCEYFGYVSDITRTWPPCGFFSSIQRAVYEIVLTNMKSCFELCHPGTSLQQIHNHSMEGLVKIGLKELGLVDASCKYPEFMIRKYNPTYIGHHLGMDVHDCESVPKHCTLEPGMVITIEPGLYFPVREDIPRRLQGIGVRIEDMVLITDSGHEVLSSSIPKDVDELENLLK